MKSQPEQKTSGAHAQAPAYQTRIGHAHLKVRNLERALAFYTRFFDLHVVERVGDGFAFLTGGNMHHELALQAIGAEAAAPSPGGVGLYHVAFEVPDKRSFALALHSLTEAGVRVGTIDHLISWAMYFSDPDGNGLEIYCDTRSEPGGQPLWHGQNRPLTAAAVERALVE